MAVVLIVEDEPVVLMAMEAAIKSWGYETLTAGDVPEALAIIRSPQPIDVLFTDIYLKDAATGGCDIARMAAKQRPKMRVLYCTGFTLTAKIRAMFVEGAGCLGKPCSEQTVKEALAALLA